MCTKQALIVLLAEWKNSLFGSSFQINARQIDMDDLNRRAERILRSLRYNISSSEIITIIIICENGKL